MKVTVANDSKLVMTELGIAKPAACALSLLMGSYPNGISYLATLGKVLSAHKAILLL